MYFFGLRFVHYRLFKFLTFPCKPAVVEGWSHHITASHSTNTERSRILADNSRMLVLMPGKQFPRHFLWRESEVVFWQTKPIDFSGFKWIAMGKGQRSINHCILIIF